MSNFTSPFEEDVQMGSPSSSPARLSLTQQYERHRGPDAQSLAYPSTRDAFCLPSSSSGPSSLPPFSNIVQPTMGFGSFGAPLGSGAGVLGLGARPSRPSLLSLQYNHRSQEDSGDPLAEEEMTQFPPPIPIAKPPDHPNGLQPSPMIRRTHRSSDSGLRGMVVPRNSPDEGRDENPFTVASASPEKSMAKQRFILEGRLPGPRLPGPLKAALLAESDLPGAEIRSEALLQRLILAPASSPRPPPRPIRNGRMMSSFSEMDSDDESSDGGSMGFAMDESADSDSAGPSGRGGMELEEDGVGVAGPGPGSMGYGLVRRPGGRGSMNGLNGFGGMGVVEERVATSPRADQIALPNMLWRGPTPTSNRVSKRKAPSDESPARFEPYTKRTRQTTDATTASHHTHHSPISSTTHIPPSPASIDSDHPHPLSTRSNPARSRAGSPAPAHQPSSSLGRAISPVASSPLGHRPTIGMGGSLGMLLLSKRNANAMGLIGGEAGEGVVEGLEGMEVGRRESDDGMVFD